MLPLGEFETQAMYLAGKTRVKILVRKLSLCFTGGCKLRDALSD